MLTYCLFANYPMIASITATNMETVKIVQPNPAPITLSSQPSRWRQWQDTTQRSTLSLAQVKHLGLGFRGDCDLFHFPILLHLLTTHSSCRQAVCFNLCSVSLEQPIWAEAEADKRGGEGEWEMKVAKGKGRCKKCLGCTDLAKINIAGTMGTSFLSVSLSAVSLTRLLLFLS